MEHKNFFSLTGLNKDNVDTATDNFFAGRKTISDTESFCSHTLRTMISVRFP